MWEGIVLASVFVPLLSKHPPIRPLVSTFILLVIATIIVLFALLAFFQ
jgi:hypothetical protein